MKLYHATTVYQILNVIAHKKQNDSFGDDILILAPWMQKNIENTKLLSTLFKKVYYYDAVLRFDDPARLEVEINKNIEDFLSKNRIKLASFDEIVVGGAQYIFGIYLCSNGIPFSAIEESCGIYSHPEVVREIDKGIKGAGARPELAESLGIYDYSNEAIKKVYCDKDAQAEGFESNKIADFKVLEILKSADKETADKLLAIFGVDKKVELDKSGVFLLTQQFTNLGIMSFKEHLLVYQLFSDFFLKGKKIFIKPHPDDICYYSQLLKGATVIRERFPSELTPFVFENLPETIATISSTGIKPLRYLFENEICLDFSYEKNFRGTLKSYTALQYAIKAGMRSCKLVDASEALFKNLAKTLESDIEIELVKEPEALEYTQDTAIIIDTCAHEAKYIKKLIAKGFDLYLFINSRADYGFYRFGCKSELESFLPIIIKKTKLREDDNYIDYEDEVLYAYSPKKEIYDTMKKVTVEKELENTGVAFQVKGMTDEQLEIERLKGILAATEKRLIYYINKDKEEEEK